MEAVLTGNSSTYAYEVTSSIYNSTEFNLDAFLKNHLGSRNRDLPGSLALTIIIIIIIIITIFHLPGSVALTIVYGLIFVTGLLGNACTCVVIATNGHLHTATNYYLFSLAISDLLTLILGQYHNVKTVVFYLVGFLCRVTSYSLTLLFY